MSTKVPLMSVLCEPSPVFARKRRSAQASRLRPDMLFRELVYAWLTARSPAPKSVYAAERAVAQLTAWVGDIPVAQFTRDGESGCWQSAPLSRFPELHHGYLVEIKAIALRRE